MKLWIISLMLLFPKSDAYQESAKLSCEYPSLHIAAFSQGSLRDEMAQVVNNTVKSLHALGMNKDQICRSGIYVRARKLYERVEQEQAAEAAAKLKYSSKESSL